MYQLIMVQRNALYCIDVQRNELACVPRQCLCIHAYRRRVVIASVYVFTTLASFIHMRAFFDLYIYIYIYIHTHLYMQADMYTSDI